MLSLRLLSLGVLAGTALCVPFSGNLESHSLGRRDNCTFRISLCVLVDLVRGKAQY